ncbi:barstar family protein [Streptomyces venezuelae]|uniref:barstar family protein n=1 Tax=Streptomyces venezuelae TaxID=54571 RepID=UPI0037AB7025
MTDSQLIVDLRGRLIETLNDFWDAVSEPCGLPEWFGRNLDAWSDTIASPGTCGGTLTNSCCFALAWTTSPSGSTT